MKTRKRRSPGSWLMRIGLLLLAGALALTGYNVWDEHRADTAAQSVLTALREKTGFSETEMQDSTVAPANNSPLHFPALTDKTDRAESTEAATESSMPSTAPEELPAYMTHQEMPTVEIDGNLYIGILEIPALELNLPIISQWSNQALRIAPCRYSGSAYQGDLVIAGHNYRGHFGSLRQLSTGDSVVLTDMAGNQFFYEVAEIQTLEPTALENAITDGWDLTLFTCTVGGKTRLTVRCQNIYSEYAAINGT